MISLPAAIRDDTVRAPWQVERQRLWSLLEMLRFYGAVFFTVVTELEHARSLLMLYDLAPSGGDRATSIATRIVKILTTMREEMAKLPLPPSVQGRLKRLVSALDGTITSERSVLLTTLVGELQTDLQLELAQHLFLLVPAERKGLFIEPEKWFGEDMATKFSEARLDMRDCAKCLALDQWTASVFHAMAIMEHGLRHLAARVGVPFSVPFNLESWHTVIEQIESKIKAMKQLPRDQQDPAEITFCSNAASHFFAVKEAWRNHVSHGRGRYDEVEALRIVQNVRDFMRVLA